MSRSDQEYIEFCIWQGEEGELSLQTVKIRTARKEHHCMSFSETNSHTITLGQRYRHERARVDGDFWGEWKICLSCMDKWINELEGEESDD
ncbi:hypothetical protein [Iodobacter fluviatilis]|uniref:Uncharacterized protein n=1 Tax=Iodobacter fluviatilis TaxID=537 RepID=A0A7G3GCN4_9NEIS|nr:hypothetical protein [Iodobacter fluviatilis]QBC44425.1 hypothetical protein C1H71_13400 [Iodobacter fluviatilis]